MGESIIKLYRDKVKKEWKTAFLSAVIMGFMVHFYRFTNYFPNHDGLFNFWSTQNMVASGRWFLAPAIIFVESILAKTSPNASIASSMAYS